MKPREQSNSGIPVIDISSSNPTAPQELLSAARKFGFIYIANNNDTGISPSLISKLFDLSREFFALPISVKEKVKIGSNSAGENVGWLAQGIEKLDPKGQRRADVKEAFNLSLPNPEGKFAQPLPAPFARDLASIVEFERACYTLCHRILENFALALEIDKDWFTSRHDPAAGSVGSIFRFLYYPQRQRVGRNDDDDDDDDDDGVDIRAGAHSDYGSVTCLFQLPGQPGLEIQNAEGEWMAVPVDPMEEEEGNLPILVNIGDLLEDWTGGLLKSTVHRVVFPKSDEGGGGDRYSMAYFCHPLDEALLEPVPSKLVEEHAKKVGRGNGKQGLTARDHLMERLAATYKIGK